MGYKISLNLPYAAPRRLSRVLKKKGPFWSLNRPLLVCTYGSGVYNCRQSRLKFLTAEISFFSVLMCRTALDAVAATADAKGLPRALTVDISSFVHTPLGHTLYHSHDSHLLLYIHAILQSDLQYADI